MQTICRYSRFSANSTFGFQDAHNCILDFDEDTALFAVYDGHGGAEVAAYASQEFPNCLRNIEEYKKGLFTEALINAFLKFDDSVKTPEAIKRLMQLVVEPTNGICV